METSILPLSIIIPLLLFLLRWSRTKSAGLPPGPRQWPLLGNIPHLLKKHPQPLHVALASLSRAHGTHLLHLRLGTQPLVVASSPAAASEVLKTHDLALSTRHVPASYQVPGYVDHSFVWSVQRDDRWKSLRSLFRTELLSHGALERGSSTREEKAFEMVGFLRARDGEEVDVGELAFGTVFDMFGRTVVSRDLMEDVEWDISGTMMRGLELGSVPNLEDFFPNLLGGWDVQRLRSEVSFLVGKIYGFWEQIIRERTDEKKKNAHATGDLLDVLLRSGLEGSHLKAILLDLFTAGTETTSTSIEWTMSELVRNPEAMERLKEELRAEESPLHESRLLHLPYLQACIKETLRLHPPVPLLLPRRALDSCEVMGYTIPKGSMVLVNAWAIGRNPNIWEDPLTFSPERFLGGKDVKENDFEMIPFGSGRRMCPGSTLAHRIISLTIASMVRSFEWSLPDGVPASELSMEEKASLVGKRKEPLVIIPASSAVPQTLQ